MKVKFEFDSESENFSYHELEMYKQAEDSAHALSEIKDKMRSWLKYDQIPYVDENSFFWDDLTEEEKQKYKENKIPDVDKMTDEIYAIINENVSMEKMGY